MAEPDSLSFSSPLDPTSSKSSRFKKTVLIFALVAGAILVLTRLYFAAAIVLLGSIVFTIESNHKRRRIVRISYDGVQIGTRQLNYQSLKSFWISNGSKPVLFLEPKGSYLVPISTPISGYDPIEVRDFLRHHLPEEVHSSERWIALFATLID